MLSIRTNLSSLITHKSFTNSTYGLNKTIEKLSTGSKLNHASDNAAGYSIVTGLNTKINSLLQVQDNTEEGISLLSTAQGALENISSLLDRLEQLSIQAMNGTYDANSIKAIEEESEAIIAQINQIRENTEYNGQKLFYRMKDDTNSDSGIALVSDTGIESPEPVVAQNIATASSIDTAQAYTGHVDGTLSFSANESRSVNIEGKTYTIENKLSETQTLSYVKNTTNGTITLIGSNFLMSDNDDIRVIGDNNTIESSQFTLVSGNNNSFECHTFGIEGVMCLMNSGYSLYSFSGVCSYNSDTNEAVVNCSDLTGLYIGNIVQNPINLTWYGDNNNAIYFGTHSTCDLTIIGNSNNIQGFGVEGTNIVVHGDSNNIAGTNLVYKVKVNGDNNTVKLGDANDEVIIYSGSNNVVDGQGGDRNTIIDYGTSTTITNAIEVTPFKLELKIDVGTEDSSFINTSISFYTFDLDLDFSSKNGILKNLELIKKVRAQVEEQSLNVGTSINRLESVLESQSIKLENLLSTRSTIRDADISEVSSQYIQQQILQQASATLLATANQTPDLALRLIVNSRIS